MKDVSAAVQGMTSEQDRAKALADLATQNQLGGLYDPVSGSFVGANGQISSTADKNTDFKLSNMGLIPSNAHTSTLLGRIFGTSGKDYDAQLRQQSGKVNADRTSQEVNQANLKKLFTLVDQLKSIKPAGGDTAPVTTTDPKPPAPAPTPTPAPAPGPHPTGADTGMTTGQKVGIGAGIGAGALSAAALARKAGAGPLGTAGAGLIGGAVGGLGARAMQKEGIEFKSSIAQSLTESFGYDYEGEQLDEYSMQQFGQDAGDTLRGGLNGVTLGTYDNIAAGVQSAFGKDTYKQALAQQTAASKEAEKRSPLLYTAGNIAGSIAAPIPGGAIAGGLIKGGSKLAGLGRMAAGGAINYGAQTGVDKLKQVADTKTLGYDPSKYPTTPAEIKAFQKANGLGVDGVIGPKTKAVLAKMGLEPAAAPSVAESIKSLQDRLAMIESGADDYHVWLMEDGTIVDQQGTIITDNATLESIEWTSAVNQELLEAISLGGIGKALGRGWDKVANVGRNVAGGFAGKDATGNLIKGTEKDFAGRMASPKANGKIRSAAEIARDSTNARGTANMANKAANWVGKNPGKAALGVGLAGAGGVAAANALGGGADADTSTAGTTTGGGGNSGGGSVADAGKGAADATGQAGDTPATTTPATPAGPSPEQQAIIDQIREVMGQLADVEDVGIQRALSDAQATIDAVSKQAPAKPEAGGGGMKAPPTKGSAALDGTKPGANPATTIPGGPQTAAGNTPKPDVNKSAGTPTNNNMAEGDELARWLKIARG